MAVMTLARARIGFFLGLAATSASLCACSSTPATAAGDGGAQAEAQAGDGGLVSAPQTETCADAGAGCLSGTVTMSGFTVAPMGLQVSLFRVFPYGKTTSVQKLPVAEDGTFAFKNVDPWAHYYVKAEAGFQGTGSSPNLVTSVVGPASVPQSGGPISLTIKPVFLEVFQQAPSGGATTLGWASAHVYDPVTGAERSDAVASFAAGGQSWPMPYVQGASGTKSYFVLLPAAVPGGTSFTITTEDTAASLPSRTWNLVGEPATFVGAVTQPTSMTPAKVGSPLAVTWQAVPAASYEVLELFFGQGTTATTPLYVSPSSDAPDTTTETIPGSALAMPGVYLLDLVYSNATCPSTADGCVYNDSTFPVSFMAQ
jgi:hypothetical protein